METSQWIFFNLSLYVGYDVASAQKQARGYTRRSSRQISDSHVT